MEEIKGFLKKIFILTFFIVFSTYILCLVSSLFSLGFNSINILNFTDKYLKLVLTSWPASVLILGIILLVTQQNAIDEFIRKRLTSIGPNGVNAATPIATDASEKEIKAKAIEDIKETVTISTNKEVEKNLESEQKHYPAQGDLSIEEGVQKNRVYSKNPDIITKLKKNREIEELAQVYLQTKYGEAYKPHIKLTKDNSSIILDGLLTISKRKLCAVEIRYIGQNNKSDVLKFIMIRLRDRLRNFGIRRSKLVVIADDLDIKNAQRLQNLFLGLISSVEFYNLKNNSLEQLNLPLTVEPEVETAA